MTTCVAAAFNYFIDPYGLFGSERIEGLNAIKPSSVTRMRMVKPYQVLRKSPRTLIAGNSRPEIGFDPQGACWSDEFKPVYNLSMPGSHVYLQSRSIQHALETGTVRHIFLGIDFLAFLQEAGWQVTLYGNHPARMERAKERNTETFKRSKGEDVPYKIANTHKPIYKLNSDGKVLAKYKSADEWCEINNEPIRKAQSLVKAARGLALTAFGDIWVFEEDYNKLNKK